MTGDSGDGDFGPVQKRQGVLASRPDRHGADVNACMCRTIVLAADPEDRDEWTQQVVDWNKKCVGAKSGHLGHLFESQKVSEDRIKELTNIEKLEVADITLQKCRAQGSEIVYVRWLDDAARGTPGDPDSVRSIVDATQVNTYDREDVVQATLPIKASRIILSPAATKTNAKDQHYSSGVGWRSTKAWYGERETNKRWGNEVKIILIDESVVDVPTTIVSENHGYVTVRRGTDFLSRVVVLQRQV